MPERGPDDRESTLRWWLRSSGDDLADETRSATLFAAVMVPAAAIGYLVDGGRGAVVGAILGGALVVLWMVLSTAWSAARALRRRADQDRQDDQERLGDQDAPGGQ